jgi:UDP-N-acetylmuramate dehydrogenase
MPLPTPAAAALREAGLACAEDVPLARKTWWRAGGPADGYVEVDTLDALRAVQAIALRLDLPVFPLGNASNLLISDAGIRGLVIRLTGALAQVTAAGSPPLLTIGAGAKLVPLITRAQREGWTGLEPLAGVPGTLGGAVCMNAGTRLGEIRDVLVDVHLVLRGGDEQTLPRDALQMRYRHSVLPAGAVLASARLQTTGADPDQSRAEIAEHLAYRARTQPVDVPTCGSTFRNPPGDSAGRLIEATGLKGARIGGAVVSDKHANFLVNTGDATASDLAALIRHIQQRVADAHGVWLEPEVHFAGDWAAPPALGNPSARDI